MIKKTEKTEILVKKSKNLLFKTLNCCESQIAPIQELFDFTCPSLRSAVTGLAGGIHNHGSTCGSVFGGALNLAVRHRAASQTWDTSNEINLLLDVQEFVKSFEQEFGSSLCRERTGLNFQTFSGKIGLLNPYKAKGCVKQTAWAMDYVMTSKLRSSDPAIDTLDNCSTTIFEEVEQRTGISDLHLQQLSAGLCGGIGLGGGGCTALTTAIMLLGVKFGNEDLKKGKRRNPLKLAPSKFIKTGNKLIKSFKEKFGSLECKAITKTSFEDIKHFNEYRSEGHCDEISKFIIDFIVEAFSQP